MTPIDAAVIVAGFVLILVFGGAVADSRERRDARNRNQARRIR